MSERPNFNILQPSLRRYPQSQPRSNLATPYNTSLSQHERACRAEIDADLNLTQPGVNARSKIGILDATNKFFSAGPVSPVVGEFPYSMSANSAEHCEPDTALYWTSISTSDLGSSLSQHRLSRTPSPSGPCTSNVTPTSSPMVRGPSRSRTPRSKKLPPDENFVKRPLNSFMLYRKDHQHNIPTNNHQSISRIIGDMWRKETAETKNYYDKLAKEERERHQVANPGYKFQPKKKKDSKPSKVGLKLQRSKSSLRTSDPGDSASFSTEANLESVVPMQPHMQQIPYYGLEPRMAHSSYASGTMLGQTGQPRAPTYGLPAHYAHYADTIHDLDPQMYASPYERMPHQEAAVQTAQELGMIDPQFPSMGPERQALSQPIHALFDPQNIGWLEDARQLAEYDMPATFVEWDRQHSADERAWHPPSDALGTQTQEHEPQSFQYGPESNVLYTADDFHPFHYRYPQTSDWPASYISGSWELEHEQSF